MSEKIRILSEQWFESNHLTFLYKYLVGALQNNRKKRGGEFPLISGLGYVKGKCTLVSKLYLEAKQDGGIKFKLHAQWVEEQKDERKD